MKKDLARLFSPRAVAIIGASQDLASASGQPAAHLKSHGYRGAIYPINPKYPEIAGYKAYPAVGELPEIPDLALILVNAARVPAVLRECGEKGIPFVIIFSSGFAETGAEGRQLQREVSALAEQYGIGVVGPNVQGMMNIPDNVYAGFGQPFMTGPFRSGPISMISQSGGFGYSMAGRAEEAGLGFCKIMSIGNEAGLSSIDFMQYFVDDPGTRIIVSYIEGLRDAHRLAEVGAAALRRRKPMLIWKVGKTEFGQKAAAAHTSNLGGNSTLYEAAFKQHGMIPLDDVQDLIDYSKAFLYGRLPAGNRVAVVSSSGGAGVVLADQCAQSGLELPSLSAASIRKLQQLLPSFSSMGNPIDATPALYAGPSGHERVRQVLQIVLDDPGIDSLILSLGALQGALATRVAEQIVELNRGTAKPVFVAWSARERLITDVYRLLEDARIPVYQTPVRCGRSLGVVARFTAACSRAETARGASVLTLERPAVRSALRTKHRHDAYVSEHAAKCLLQDYGISATREELACDQPSARLIAQRIGYPVALKVQSPDVPHKTEAGAVRLGITSDEELDLAYRDILENVRRHNPLARIEGVLVQEMVQDAVEVILGIVNNPQFGPAIMFGLGGIFVEILKDVAFRFAPVSHAVALEMIREIKAYPILEGARGRARADVEALATTITRLSALAIDLKDEVAALDINPLFVFPLAGGVKAGDALITLCNRSP